LAQFGSILEDHEGVGPLDAEETLTALKEVKFRLDGDEVRSSDRVPRLFGVPRETVEDNFTDCTVGRGTPIGIPCLLNTAIKVAEVESLNESKAMTFCTASTTPSAGNACKCFTMFTSSLAE
jgi:hypothetical protein